MAAAQQQQQPQPQFVANKLTYCCSVFNFKPLSKVTRDSYTQTLGQTVRQTDRDTQTVIHRQRRISCISFEATQEFRRYLVEVGVHRRACLQDISIVGKKLIVQVTVISNGHLTISCMAEGSKSCACLIQLVTC